MDTVEELNGTYFYDGTSNLSASELFYWIMIDEIIDHFGAKDIAAVAAIFSGHNGIYVSGKFNGAIKGTSPASKAARRLFRNKESRIKLPTLIGYPPKVKLIMTKKLGTFVGRAIPVVGWVILASDIAEISYKTTIKYNTIARSEDRLY